MPTAQWSVAWRAAFVGSLLYGPRAGLCPGGPHASWEPPAAAFGPKPRAGPRPGGLSAGWEPPAAA
eukprot:351395-Chlamydomonas_euryale.AAC.12